MFYPDQGGPSSLTYKQSVSGKITSSQADLAIPQQTPGQKRRKLIQKAPSYAQAFNGLSLQLRRNNATTQPQLYPPPQRFQQRESAPITTSKMNTPLRKGNLTESRYPLIVRIDEQSPTNARRSVKILQNVDQQHDSIFQAKRDSSINSDQADLRDEPKLSNFPKKRPPFPVSISAKSHRLQN